MQKDKKALIEKVTLKLFLACMIICAGLFLFAIWTRGPEDNPTMMATVMTFFVVGLANFLIWLPLVIYRLIEVLKQKNEPKN